MPRVLFSAPECRAVVVDLDGGETMGDHKVRERAVVEVVTGRVSIEASGDAVTCDAGAPFSSNRANATRCTRSRMPDYC